MCLGNSRQMSSLQGGYVCDGDVFAGLDINFGADVNHF